MRSRTPPLRRLLQAAAALAWFPPVRIVLFLLALVGLGLLAGCATQPQLVEVKVPVPVECRVDTPAAPAMPSKSLTEASTLDQVVAALLAEIELREGFEIELLTALATCTAPIAGAPAAPPP